MTSRRAGIGMTSARTRDRLVSRLQESGIGDASVLEAIRRVPRHLFVDEALAHRAYEDTALPIGHGQTISQPYTVARMTALLLAEGARRVLEIGTGSGYQTAVLCALVDEVYSVERIEPLLRSARRGLQELGFRNFRLKHADGSQGWIDYAPFDAILITAAAAEIPEALVGQLAPAGRMVAPLTNGDRQELVLLRRTPEGDVREILELVNFVPLVADPAG
jgi:protein-L-isoaspartate(D-aspartate) O-methyltransferase